MLVLARVELFFFTAANKSYALNLCWRRYILEHQWLCMRSNPKWLQLVDKCKLEQEQRERFKTIKPHSKGSGVELVVEILSIVVTMT